MSDIETRVLQFRMLALPGQPMSMHMGTAALVNDMWKEIDADKAIMRQALDAIEEENPLAWSDLVSALKERLK